MFFHISEYPKDKVPEVGDEVQFRSALRNQRVNCFQLSLLPKGTVQFLELQETDVQGTVVAALTRSRDREGGQQGTIQRSGCVMTS